VTVGLLIFIGFSLLMFQLMFHMTMVSGLVMFLTVRWFLSLSMPLQRGRQV
jgi:hypothetical protein